MRQVAVEVKPDHLESIAHTRPVSAISELIWNALDADAQHVRVQLTRDFSDTLTKIQIADDGHGMTEAEVEVAFGSLGGSWKRASDLTRHKRRVLHGKEGKGRFKAFALGATVEWFSSFELAGARKPIHVITSLHNPGVCRIEVDAPTGKTKGTVVEVTDVSEASSSLLSPRTLDELAEIFAPYLRQYPDVRITYDGNPLDPSSVEEAVSDYQLGPALIENDGSPGTQYPVTLTVIEWKRPMNRSVHLCNQYGFSYGSIAPTIHAPGFDFTAYVKSEAIKKLHEQNVLGLAELSPALQGIIDETKRALRDHFRKRAAERTAGAVETWKKEKVYPYSGEPATVIERASRQVFDVVAVNIAEYLPEFDEADKKSKQLQFRLLRQALEENPRSLGRILEDVLNLPRQRQDELAALLERTTLAAIIAASKEIADRLNFLKGLEVLVFDPHTKEQVLERKQLHRILAPNSWLFGEEFRLSVDDQSLTEVLERHLETLRQEEKPKRKSRKSDSVAPKAQPVLRDDGRVGIVDLMLSRRIGRNQPQKREHVIVELKRPAKVLGPHEIQQLESYAYAVARDERFRDGKVEWKFWLVGNQMSELARFKITNEETGQIHTKNNITLFMKTWGELIDQAKARLHFYEERLEYNADRDSGWAYLRETHGKYLPSVATELASIEQQLEISTT